MVTEIATWDDSQQQNSVDASAFGSSSISVFISPDNRFQAGMMIIKHHNRSSFGMVVTL